MLSTYARCRKLETGDEGEGTLTYESGTANDNSDDPDLQTVLERSGIYIRANVRGITIDNCETYSTVPDAYLLCLSDTFGEDLRQRFGNYCVEIWNPDAFFAALTQRVAEKLHGLGYSRFHTDLAPVTYRVRRYEGIDPERNALLLKPENLAYEREYRMVWLPENVSSILPEQTIVTCYAGAPFLRRIA